MYDQITRILPDTPLWHQANRLHSFFENIRGLQPHPADANIVMWHEENFSSAYYAALEMLPLEMEAVGLTSNIVQVTSIDGHFTADKVYPSILNAKKLAQKIGDPENTYFMFSPVDYKGEFFYPADLSSWDSYEWSATKVMLFSNGTDAAAHIIPPSPPIHVSVPAGFVNGKHQYAKR